MKPMTIVHGRDGSAAQLIGGTAEQAAMVFNAQHQHASQYRPVLQVSHSVTPPVRSMSSSTERSAKHDGPKNVMKRNGRKACNCTRSACLKLYCDCFANGEFCDGCNCKDCYNNLDHDFERSKAIKQCLERNPNAFQPKIAPTSRGRAEGERVHLKGCHCKRSNCLKNYCECYEARVACSNRCKCVGCCNVDSNRFDGGGGQPGSSFVGLNAARSQFSQRSGAHFPNSGLMSLAAAAAADMDATSPGGAHDGSQSMMHSAGGSTGQLDPKASRKLASTLIGALVGLVSAGASLVLGMFLFAGGKRRARVKPIASLDSQTKQSPSGDGAARVCTSLGDRQLVAYTFEDAKTLFDAVRRGAKQTLSGDCLGYRHLAADGKTRLEYTWISYDDVIRRSENFANGLLELGLNEGQKTFVGIFSKNRPEPPAPTSIATVCYTSGTTGLPKGAIITHGNVIAAAAALEYFRHVQLGPDDIEMSFLPLAHMFERLIQAACYQIGGKVGFFSGDIKLLSDDFQKLKPTIVAVVPRVLNRIYDAVQQQCASGVKRKLLEWALASKTAQLNQGILRNDTFWDSIVFRKVRNRMGGRLKLVFTGAAPLGEHVLTFTRCALGCVVVEGYGQTECAAACSVTLEGDHTPGHVGVPCPACEIKLVDVPEMEYYAAQGKGEICVRGHNVFQGYYNDAEKTAEALDSDGWLHTGDVGTWTSSGVLKIIDRKKNLLKLAQGEYVSPEKVETVYISSTLVGQIFVHGESLKSCLIAVVVPDEEVLPRKVAQSLPHLKDKDVKALCAEPEVKKLISADMLAVAKKAGLHSFEQAKDIYLEAEPFSVENDLLTPTMKSKRPQLKERYKNEIAKMYAKLD